MRPEPIYVEIGVGEALASCCGVNLALAPGGLGFGPEGADVEGAVFAGLKPGTSTVILLRGSRCVRAGCVRCDSGMLRRGAWGTSGFAAVNGTGG